MPTGYNLVALVLALLALPVALPAAAAPKETEIPVATNTAKVLFRQPALDGFGDRLYVIARIPEETFAMISWQRNPATPDGKFIPVDWDVGVKTGLEINGNRLDAQRGMANRAGSTAAQMCGGCVGAYLNSADLSGGGVDADNHPLPGSGGYKMMVTPQIAFSPDRVGHLFQHAGDALSVSVELQVPVAACAQKKGSLAYVNPCLVFADKKRKVKISYITVCFSSRPGNSAPKVVENIAYDAPSHSWMIHSLLVPGLRWATLAEGSSTYQNAPWKGWKRFSYSITRANFETALKAFREQQPDIDCSLDPADYALQTFHLNAEITYQTAPAELGWSMRNALIRVERK